MERAKNKWIKEMYEVDPCALEQFIALSTFNLNIALLSPTKQGTLQDCRVLEPFPIQSEM
jgi:hypothetical protein